MHAHTVYKQICIETCRVQQTNCNQIQIYKHKSNAMYNVIQLCIYCMVNIYIKNGMLICTCDD